MAEGPEEARGRPPGQDDGGGDPEPVPSPGGPRTAAAAAARPRDGPQAEPQAPGRPPAPGLAPTAAAAGDSEPPREQGKRGEAASDSGAAPRERPARLSAREYSRQVHEWLWQSYCGYLTWHGGLTAVPAHCGLQAAQLAYYSPFFFLGAAAAGPDPGAAPGASAPAPGAGLGPRAPQGQGSVRAAPATRAGPAAPSRAPSEIGRQAGEKRGAEGSSGSSRGPGRARSFCPYLRPPLRLAFLRARLVVSLPGPEMPKACSEAVPCSFRTGRYEWMVTEGKEVLAPQPPRLIDLHAGES